jgi:DNA-binding CsgD family transcriptional regulator
VLTPTSSAQGFLLLDCRLRPVAYNSEAVQILSFPTKPESIRQLPQFLSDKIRSTLVHGGSMEKPVFVKECKAGRRTYCCRAFRIDCNGTGDAKSPISYALLLERQITGGVALDVLARQYDLTARECETVALLLEGLTSKEIAARMKISPNTVKAFLRLVMLKMDVSTRSGIVGKVVRPAQFT